MKNFFYLLIPTLTILASIGCQNAEIEESPEASYVEKVEIDSEFHLAHLGQITFMEEYVGLGEYDESDLLTSMNFDLANPDQQDLHIRAFMGNSLTNYLKPLAPTKTISEIVHNGNYQFSFYIDNELIYVENLNSGAGSPFTKNQYATVCVPFLSIEKVDSWGRFMWSRFMLRGGGQEALTVGSHTLKLEMRPYVDFGEVKIGEVIAKGQIQLNVQDNAQPVDSRLIAVQAIAESEDFEISTAHIKDKVIKDLNEKILRNNFKEVTSIVVLKDQKILIEEYFNGTDRATLCDTRSVGKSFAGTLLGIAIDKGLIEDEHKTLDQFYDLKKHANFHRLKQSVSLKDLMTMTSTFDGSDMDSESLGSEDRIQETDNWIDYILDLPIKEEKEKNRHWDYFTGGAILLGDILNSKTPEGIEKFAASNLFLPLGITHTAWQYTPQGIAHTAGGLRLSTLDLAKYGQLYKNNGLWNGQQIVSSKWIEKSLEPHITLPEQGNGNYGYLWYDTTFEVDGKEYKVSYAAGNGGNMIYIFRDQPLVIVITAQAYNTMEGAVQGHKMVKNYLLPAIL